jgi:hypothetical protein
MYAHMTDEISDSSQQNNSNLFYYGDPELIDLGGIVMLENSSRLVYQTNPFFITESHLSANLPCHTNYFSKITMLGGKIPEFRTISLEPIYEFSEPGRICSYQATLNSNATDPISQIVIQNNSSEELLLPLATKIMTGVSVMAKNSIGN